MEQLKQLRLEVVTVKFNLRVATRQNARLLSVNNDLKTAREAAPEAPQPAALNNKNAQLICEMSALMKQRNRRVILNLVDVISTLYAALQYEYFLVSLPPLHPR